MTTLWKRFGAIAGAAIAAAEPLGKGPWPGCGFSIRPLKVRRDECALPSCSTRTRIRLRDHGVYRTPGNCNALQFPFSDAVHVLFPYKVLDSVVTTGFMLRL